MAVYGGEVYGGSTYSGLPVLTAFDYELGTYEGRVRPDNASPAGGDYVYCLGSDKLPGQRHDLAFNDRVNLEQTIDLTGINFIRATWRVRQPEDMPETALIPGAGLFLGNRTLGVPFAYRGVLNYYDSVAYPIVQATGVGADDLMAVVASSDVFTITDTHRIVRVAGSATPGNNGDKRITGILSPRIAILDSGIAAHENPLGGGVTATLLGARWRASLWVAGVERAFVVEVPGRDVVRVDLAAHVSKLAGAQTVQFRLELVEA